MACIATERSDIGDRSHRAEVGDRRLALGLRIFLRNVTFNGKFVLSSYEYDVPVHPIR